MSWGCNFFGVNTMPNLFLWNSLYPYNYSTSYGGGVQFNTLPMTYSPAEAFAMHNATNPLYNVNQMFNNFNQMINPFQNAQYAGIQQSAYAFGQNIGSNIGLNNRFNYLANDITNLDSSIDCALNSDKVNEQQKEKLKELKQKLERLKNNLNNVANLRNQGATIEQVKASLDCIRNDFNGIKAEVEALAQEIKEQIEDNSDNASGNTTTDGNTTTGGSSTATGSNPTGDNEPASSVSQVTHKEVSDICKNIFNAIDGSGTNYDDDDNGLKPTMQKLNGNNVLDVIAQWDKAYAGLDDFKDDDAGFIESLMDDCGGKQKEEISEYLISALEDCARTKGIDADKEVAVARDAIKSNWIGWRDDDKICDAVNKLIKKVQGE